MECRLCGQPKSHKHGKMPKGQQRCFCPECQQTFSERFDTLYDWRQVSPAQVQQVLPAPSEGSRLRGISRIIKLAYNTVVSLVRAASAQAQLVHKHAVEPMSTEAVSADAMWSFLHYEDIYRNLRSGK